MFHTFLFFCLLLCSLTEAQVSDSELSGHSITNIEMQFEDMHIAIQTDYYNGAEITYTGTARSVSTGTNVYLFWGDDDDLLICDLEAYIFYHIHDRNFRLVDLREDPLKRYIRKAVYEGDPFYYVTGSMPVIKYSRDGYAVPLREDPGVDLYIIKWPNYSDETVGSIQEILSSAKEKKVSTPPQHSNESPGSCLDSDASSWVFVGIIALFIYWLFESAAKDKRRKQKAAKQKVLDNKHRIIREREERERKARHEKWKQKQVVLARERRAQRDALKQRSLQLGIDICLNIDCGTHEPLRCCRCRKCVKCSHYDSVYTSETLSKLTDRQCQRCDWDDDDDD
jgi:hypothetical protein